MGRMSTFTESDVAALAEVACIRLSEEELKVFAEDLENITKIMADIRQIAESDLDPTYHPTSLTNVFRADVVTETLDREALLEAAPDPLDGQFVVPRMLEEN